MKTIIPKIITKTSTLLQRYRHWTPPKIVVLMFLLLIYTTFFYRTFKLDNDFWFIINTGKDILSNGFVGIESFTIHSDFHYMSQQWLTSVLFYYIYNNFSITGMYILLSILNIINIYLIYKICTIVSNNSIKLSLFITAFTFSMLNINFLVTRPQIFDITLILIELFLLELYIKNNNKKYLIGLPIISLLFINLHASTWIMSIIVIIPYILGRINLKISTKNNYKLTPIFIVVALMILIALINPYGIESLVYLFNSYGIEEINKLVAEMFPLTIDKNIVVYAYIFLILVSYYISKENKINIRYFLLFIGTAYLSLQHGRGVMFLLITSIFALSDNFKNKEIPLATSFLLHNKILNIIYSLMIIMILIFGISSINFIYEKNMALYDISNYLDNNIDKQSKIYTSYDDGNYLEYRGYKCYIDTRAEIFVKSINKKEDIMLEYYSLQNGLLNYRDFLEKYNFDYLLINDQIEIMSTYIDDESNYKLIYEIYDKYEETNYKLYERADLSE